MRPSEYPGLDIPSASKLRVELIGLAMTLNIHGLDIWHTEELFVPAVGGGYVSFFFFLFFLESWSLCYFAPIYQSISRNAKIRSVSESWDDGSQT